ncbi:MAG: TetR/AcrR family transcriptional regulator, partial [Rhodobacteraceae bacterium]|nr:TetR/AcrR family transcriptional regulator [Paracoccaceae bacterium]
MSDEKPYHHGDLATALIAAAHQELSEQGAAGFSLRRVARRAGVSHAAPAHHFGDAAGLLAALAAQGFRRLIGQQSLRQGAASPDAR